MTKPGPEDMDVVEIDAIDLGDWERNMQTSEVPAAGLAALVRETAAIPVVAERGHRTATHVASTAARPAVISSTPVPARRAMWVRPPGTQDVTSDHTPAEPLTQDRIESPVPRSSRLRFVAPRVLVLAGGAIAVIIFVIAIVAHGSSPESKPPAAEPAAIASAPVVDPAPTATPAPAGTPVPITPSKPHAPPRAEPKPAISAIAPKAIAPKAIAPTKPASKPKAVHHTHASKKRTAVRSTPHSPEVAIDPDALERARAAYNEGNQAMFAGDSDAAIRAYQQVLEFSPTLAFGHRGLGLAYAQKGDYASAIKALRDYLELAPHAKDVALIRKRISGLQSTHH